MAALCLLSDEDENWLEDEEAMTADEDDVVAMEAPWAKVPLSTTVPDSPPEVHIETLNNRIYDMIPSRRLSMLALNDLASTTWDDLEAEEDLLTADEERAFRELVAWKELDASWLLLSEAWKELEACWTELEAAW